MEYENQWNKIRDEIRKVTAGIDHEKLTIRQEVENKPDGSEVITISICKL